MNNSETKLGQNVECEKRNLFTTANPSTWTIYLSCISSKSSSYVCIC